MSVVVRSKRDGSIFPRYLHLTSQANSSLASGSYDTSQLRVGEMLDIVVTTTDDQSEVIDSHYPNAGIFLDTNEVFLQFQIVAIAHRFYLWDSDGFLHGDNVTVYVEPFSDADEDLFRWLIMHETPAWANRGGESWAYQKI